MQRCFTIDVTKTLAMQLGTPSKDYQGWLGVVMGTDRCSNKRPCAVNTTLVVDTPRPPIGLVFTNQVNPPYVIRVVRMDSVTSVLSNGNC